MKKVVYVTGCLGFIGSHVTKHCLIQGWNVIGVDKITYAANEDLLPSFLSNKNFKFIKEDINELKFLYDCDYVINCAAETHVDNSIINSTEFLSSNINGVYNLLELIKTKRKFKMPILLHFSTDEVYGDIEIGSHKESDLVKPSNPYSATKASADMLILSWNRTFGVPYIIVRPTNNYGIGQNPEKLIPKACKYLQLERKIPVHEKGLPRRTWLHVNDTSRAIIHIINSAIENEIYNISGNYEDSNINVVQKILNIYFQKEMNINMFVNFEYTRPGQDVRYAIDDSKLKNLGWNPIENFDEELIKIVEYNKNNFIW